MRIRQIKSKNNLMDKYVYKRYRSNTILNNIHKVIENVNIR